MNKNYYIIPIFVPHLGCPHDCIFCNQKKITGITKTITKKDVEETIDKYLSTIDRENSFVELSFFGGSFTGIPMDYQNELLDAAKTALENGKIDDIRLSTRPDYINEYILKNLKTHGVGVIELGVQSMDDEVLNIAERGHTSLDVINSSRLIKEYGFKLGLQMMIGLPSDNLEKDIFTANEIIKIKPDFVRIYPALIIKNTKMEELFKKGCYKPLTIDEAVDISSKLYILFSKNDIPIIRLGLQATDEININKEVIAGPFHPAFRELVESLLFISIIDYIIQKYFIDSLEITISINTKDISKLFADKKKYFNKLVRLYSTKKIKVCQNNAIDRFEILISDGIIDKKMSFEKYIKLVI
ncbi:Radical SAM superfamily protein [Caloramator quimbayensis]|uniref:Radical SAM superfamily protein n=1 Tax=Caloramator quimbayensis TaxID=1147123 RepID=A0A1T4XSV5_9CLOT|nr:radical SAM protein [Caloramator quimbayensis]SKA92228.1 Radical SAM superfamily protein [Caloramator quimbayensis]